MINFKTKREEFQELIASSKDMLKYSENELEEANKSNNKEAVKDAEQMIKWCKLEIDSFLTQQMLHLCKPGATFWTTPYDVDAEIEVGIDWSKPQKLVVKSVDLEIDDEYGNYYPCATFAVTDLNGNEIYFGVLPEDFNEWIYDSEIEAKKAMIEE